MRGPFNGSAPIFLPEFRSRRSRRADRKSRSVQRDIAIPYVTPANDNVPTSLRMLAHCRALLRRLVAGFTAIIELRHDVIRDGVALTPSETIS